MRPQVIFTELRDIDPCMLSWVEIMAHIGGGRAKVKFEVAFFHFLCDQILMIEDYAYAGTDFIGDLDLPLPPGAQWGDIGKNKNPKMLIMFLYFHILCFVWVVTRPKILYADVGGAWLGGSSPMDKRDRA